MLKQLQLAQISWVGCIAGALTDSDYISKLKDAGFESIDIEPVRMYNTEDARAFLSAEGVDVDSLAGEVAEKFMSAFVRARKPKPAPCCSSGCCQ